MIELISSLIKTLGELLIPSKALAPVPVKVKDRR